MISHKHKFIFVHIPKTGGRSIQSALLSNGALHDEKNQCLLKNPHYSLGKYYNIFGDPLNSYFKFTFVRNPFSRAVSEFFYIKKKGGCVCKSSFFKKEYKTFKDFIKKGGQRCCWGGHDSNQLDLINNNDVSIDFIGKFESLQEDFNIVCDKISLPHKRLPHINKTKHANYTRYYDDETRQLVAEKYKKDIEYFGYKFGD